MERSNSYYEFGRAVQLCVHEYIFFLLEQRTSQLVNLRFHSSLHLVELLPHNRNQLHLQFKMLLEES